MPPILTAALKTVTMIATTGACIVAAWIQASAGALGPAVLIILAGGAAASALRLNDEERAAWGEDW